MWVRKGGCVRVRSQVFNNISLFVIIYNMNALLQLLCEYLTVRDVLMFVALFLATWLFYKAGIEPFLSPIHKVINH